MSFKDYYTKEVRDVVQKELKIVNVNSIPKIMKVVVNIGVGEATASKTAIEKAASDLQIITGQKPSVTKARKSVAAFKVRKGQAIGVKVTLRGQRMCDFLEKLFKIVFPRIRDFRGIDAKNFDRRGNLNIGMNDQTLFPEIEYDKIDKIRGLEVTIVTSATTDDAAKVLLEKMGLVFSVAE